MNMDAIMDVLYRSMKRCQDSANGIRNRAKNIRSSRKYAI